MKTTLNRVVLCGLWLLVVGTGVFALSNYENTPASIGKTPQIWPADSKIARQQDRPILVMFAHPYCPCTRASVGELNRLLTQAGGKAEIHVLFIAPRTMPDDWTQSALWKNAAMIPGVVVQPDPDGAEATRFGAESSGYVVLYDKRGQLLFNGGITAARGHAGDNAGENVIVSLLNGHDVNLKHTAVFGCGLLDKTESATN